MDYADLQDYLNMMAAGLDSIAYEESELLQANNTPGEQQSVNRQRMKQNLEHAREVLARHRDRIVQLERKLEQSNADTRSLRTIVQALRQQIEEKDRELEQMRTDLEAGRKSIAELKGRVQRMSQVQEEQTSTIARQQATISEQQEQLAMGFIKIATKHELKEAGLLKGGFLKKNKVDYSSFNQNLFRRVNIKEETVFQVTKKAKILTPVPESSYYIDGSLLHITNIESFWSLSTYVIIQTD